MAGRKLSKNLSEMKFMQKGSPGNENQLGDSKDGSVGVLIKKWVAPNIPVFDDLEKEMKCTSSFVECEELHRLGRFSYNKFNKEIERLSERYNRQGGLDEESSQDEEEATVSVQEMIRRYEDNTIKRFLGKHERFSDDDIEPSGSSSKSRKLSRKQIRSVEKDFMKPNF